MDTYGHLFPEAEEEGRGVLDAALAAASHPPYAPRQESAPA